MPDANYSNQNEINKLAAQLMEVDSKLRIGSMGLVGDRVTSVSLTIPLKGNKKTIDKLKGLGWKLGIRRKQRTDNIWYNRAQYSGHIMLQTMTYYL